MSASRNVKLFVSNLKWTVSPSELRRYFERFGRVSAARVLFDRNGWSRGYGFVTFRDRKGYEAAISAEEHLFGQELLHVAPVIEKAKVEEQV